MMKNVVVFAVLAVAAAATPAIVVAQSELYLTLGNGTLQRVLYDGANTYTLAGSAAVPDVTEVVLYGSGASLEIFTRTNASGNNSLREHSRAGSTLTQERILDLGGDIPTDIDVQPGTGTLTAFINETANSSRVHDYNQDPGTFSDKTIYSGYGAGVSGKIGTILGSNPPATPGNVDLIYGVDNGAGIKILQAWAAGVSGPILANGGYNADTLVIDGMTGTPFATIIGTGIQGTPETRIRVMNYRNPSKIVAESVIDGEIGTPRTILDVDHLSNSFIVSTSVDANGIGRLEGHVADLTLSNPVSPQGIAFKALIEQGSGGPTGASVLTVDQNNVVHTLDSLGNLNAYRVDFFANNDFTFSLVAQQNVGTGTSLDAAAAAIPEPAAAVLLVGVLGCVLAVVRDRRI